MDGLDDVLALIGASRRRRVARHVAGVVRKIKPVAKFGVVERNG